jgi:cytochrome c biogenesis protein
MLSGNLKLNIPRQYGTAVAEGTLFKTLTKIQGSYQRFMADDNAKNVPNAVWRFFRSVKLTIVLLILLAVASIIGTVIPQISQRESAEFARGLSPEVFRFFGALDLFDMYHAPWFRLLMGCLALNLVVCSVDRFPGTWKVFRTAPRPDRNRPFEDLLPEQAFSVAVPIEEASERIQGFLQGRYRTVVTKKAPAVYHYYVEKGRFSHFGVYLVHGSVLLILMGALVGSFLGFQGYANILENEQTNSIALFKKREHLDLGFAVRCDRFTVEYYDTGAPKEFRSDLTFLVDGQVVNQQSVRVNHPVQFRGVVFYQSSFGFIPGKTVHMRIARNGNAQKAGAMDVEVGKPTELPGDGGEFSIVDIQEDFMGMGPAVRIAVRPKNGETKDSWIFKDYEKAKLRLPGPMLLSSKFDPSAHRPFTFVLDGMERIPYTGLQANRDPGVNIVWAGCFMMIAGFCVTFFMSHVRIWVRLSAETRKNHIAAAGLANRNPVGLERELSHLLSGLKNQFREEGHLP